MVIFKKEQKEFNGFRKRLIDYFNTPGRFFVVHKFHSFVVDDIYELKLENYTGQDCYFMGCYIIRDGKKEHQTYSIDPKVLVNFLEMKN